MSEYRFSETETAIGPKHEFHGPGLGYHGCPPGLHLVKSYEAEAVVRMLAQAYEAGRRAKAAELRRSLGCAE